MNLGPSFIGESGLVLLLHDPGADVQLLSALEPSVTLLRRASYVLLLESDNSGVGDVTNLYV